MFIETHNDTIDGKNIALAFMKSANVQAYPCGRRRSELVKADTNNNSIVEDNEGYIIPFDPESRLNTEANNRKHSSLNGFTQTYLKDWLTSQTKKQLSLVLAGYSFDIKLEGDNAAVGNFGVHLEKNVLMTTCDKLYANVVLEEVPLYKGFQDYNTEILRNQVGTSTDLPKDCLDLAKKAVLDMSDGTDKLRELQDFNNYYFAGLSFSAESITGSVETRSEKVISFIRNGNSSKQTLVSLRILEKIKGVWRIHQPAFLPKVEHGITEDSIVITGDASLESDLEVLGKADVNGNITSRSNIIASGNSETAGNIIADRNIRAKNDITADRFLNVKDNAKILKNLTVGPEAEGDGEGDPGTITAKRHVETPTLNASTSVTTPTATISTKLAIQSGDTSNPAQANIDEATITDAEIINKITTKDLESTGVILANIIGDTQDKVENIIANTASIDTLTADTINADDIQQKIDSVYRDVPVIFVQPQKSASTNKTEYQLQIRRVNILTEQQVD